MAGGTRKSRVSFSRRRRSKNTRPRTRLATKEYVKKQIRKDDETKFFDVTAFNGTGIDTSGTFVQLSNPAQGAGDSQRVGDKITMRSMRIAWTAVPYDYYNVMRIIVFQWYPNTVLTVPAIQLILENTGQPTLSPIRHDHSGNQFKVLRDFRFTMVTPAGANVGNPSSVRTGTFKVPFKWVKKTCDFTSGTQNCANMIYVYVVSDSSAVGHPSITMLTRLWYDDA